MLGFASVIFCVASTVPLLNQCTWLVIRQAFAVSLLLQSIPDLNSGPTVASKLMGSRGSHHTPRKSSFRRKSRSSRSGSVSGHTFHGRTSSRDSVGNASFASESSRASSVSFATPRTLTPKMSQGSEFMKRARHHHRRSSMKGIAKASLAVSAVKTAVAKAKAASTHLIMPDEVRPFRSECNKQLRSCVTFLFLLW